MTLASILGPVIAVVATAIVHMLISRQSLGEFQGIVKTRLDGLDKDVADHEERLRTQERGGQRFHVAHGGGD